MARHRRSRQRQHDNSRSHESTAARAFNDRGSNSWDGRDHRRESRLGSHLVSNARVEAQSHFGRPWRRYEFQERHDHRDPDNSRLQHRSVSTTNTYQPHRDSRYRKYDHVIRDLFVQGSVIEQKLRRLLDGLAHIQPSSEEMEWENTNSVYYVPLALANVVGGREADAVASSPRQEDGGSKTSANAPAPAPGQRSTRLPSLLGPPPAVIPSRLSLQNPKKALVHTAAVAPNPEGHCSQRSGLVGVGEPCVLDSPPT